MSTPDFSRRATASELMDDDALPAATYAAVLQDLARVNVVTRAAAPTLAWLRTAAAGRRSLRILDVGFGYGDMLRRIARWARAQQQTVELIGVDLNPKSAPIARAATDPSDVIQYYTGDATTMDLAPDVIISSLVAHHLTDADLVEMLRWMEATATVGWFINDLHRHRLAWMGYRALAAVARWHPIVQHDGALSVRRAFVRDDWRRLIHTAGLTDDDITMRWHLPFRLCVGRVR